MCPQGGLYWPLVLFVSFSVGCESSPYKGFDQIGEGIHLELHRFGDTEVLASDSDRVGITYAISLLGDDPPGSLFKGQRLWVFGSTPIRGLSPVFKRLGPGDSATVLLPASKVPWSLLVGRAIERPDDDRIISMEIRMDMILDPREVLQEEALFNEWAQARGSEEWDALKRYFKKIQVVPDSVRFSGVYVIPQEEGSGELLRSGERVQIRYKARFLDGTMFDDATKADPPMSFILGDPGQVIVGVDRGLRRMREGGKATIIIPSALAFGAMGSSTGIVDPFTTVVYEMEVLAVERGS